MYTMPAIPFTGQDGGPDTEPRLIAAAQRDLAAFAPLYQRYRDRVYAYLRTRAAGPDDAADVTQQVFLQALAALPRYRIPT